MFILKLPLFVQIGKKQRFYLNLNQYRNAHFFTLNKAKILFADQVREQIESLPELGCVGITYTLFPGSNRDMDISNVCSIVDKFLCDALVDEKKLIDDSLNIVRGVQYLYGQADKGNGRVEAAINMVGNSPH